ncbi:MAG: PQQ-binding-like beta-propeller repeat protein, partial [Actinomycetota bacterium]|nr:PQQ-binding-like beta-propeller repeat protein [Actinomycetota bacterium]
ERRRARRRAVRVRRASALFIVAVLAVGVWQLVVRTTGEGGERASGPVAAQAKRPAHDRAQATTTAAQPRGAINPKVSGITTFRGNLTRTYYGEGPVPRRPKILWRYPRRGALCSQSADESGTHTWCGIGWTGQPNVIPHKRGRTLELRFGAYDAHYHFLNARTGRPMRPDVVTGDLAKGSATSDPDGYPLYYAGSRDNLFRIIALDRRPTVLWSMDANTSVPYMVWNNDWDGAALIVGDYLLEGGENSWFYVVKLNRGWTRKGKVRVRPRIVLTVPSWDARLERDAPDRHFSIENSVAFRNGIVYFANSAGLVQGWNIARILRGGRGARRVFRFWTGDDTDASVVIDDKGYLYVASELEKFNARSRQVGQLMKLNPYRRKRPLVWRVHLRETNAGAGGSWSTPALDRGMVYVATNRGGVVGVDRRTGTVLWKIRLPGPTWGSPVVVDNVLLEGDCAGVLHAYDVANQRRRPRELWRIKLGGCIEATPAVWRGRIFVGTRAGAMYAIGEKRR